MTGCDYAVEHPVEDEMVQGVDDVPVGQSEETGRIENGGLADSGGFIVSFHFELQPCTSGQFHLGQKPQAPARFEYLHPPAIEGIAHREGIRVAPASTHSHAAGEQVEETAQFPQPVGIIPARISTDARNGFEGRSRRAIHSRSAGVDEPLAEAHPSPITCIPCGVKNGTRIINLQSRRWRPYSRIRSP